MLEGGGRDRGQATVELALSLPALAVLLGFVVEISLVSADQVRLWHAAREAARIAVVDPDHETILAAASRSGLQGIELHISPEPDYRVQGRPVTVSLAYNPSGRVPLIGELSSRIELRARASMRIEEP
ncbi:MAG: pilus assembly protein [Actinomycetota bacterium]|nr:pilus assembly protein [Actinomycetota bacterium]